MCLDARLSLMAGKLGRRREIHDCLLVYSKSDKVIARYKRLGRGFETQVDASLPDVQGTGKTRTKIERFLGTDDTLIT